MKSSVHGSCRRVALGHVSGVFLAGKVERRDGAAGRRLCLGDYTATRENAAARAGGAVLASARITDSENLSISSS